jgi:hypothetical protein
VILEKLIVSQLVKKFPHLLWNRRFITMFTRAYPEPDASRPNLPTLSNPRPFVTFRNKLFFYGEDF